MSLRQPSSRARSPSADTRPVTPLSAALRVGTATLIYDVRVVADVLRTIESCTASKVEVVDGRGDLSESAFRAAVERHSEEGGTVIVLLGLEMGSGVRSILSGFSDDPVKVKLIALSPAASPSGEMASVFPLQMAAARVLQWNA